MCTCMIYGDQSQEGFLLRDYFCCDTNELRLQIHCRPITLEKRLLAYYSQIISGFYPPCYSSSYTHEHLLFAGCAWLSVCCIYTYMSVFAYYNPAIQMDSGLLSVMLCCLYWGAPACWFITPALCCQSSPLDCIIGAPICHLCMCQIAAGLGKRDVWLQGNLANSRPMRKEKMREERGIKISLYSVIGLF